MAGVVATTVLELCPWTVGPAAHRPSRTQLNIIFWEDHHHGYHADPPPSVALNSSGGSGEVQATTESGLTFIKRDGWVFVSGQANGSEGFLDSAFCPPSTVRIPYLSGNSGGNMIRIQSSGSVEALWEGFIQPTVYPAREA